jgi:hypothetical protein
MVRVSPMNVSLRVMVLLLIVLAACAPLSAQWVKCTDIPGNDSIYTNPAGTGLRDLAVNGSRLFAMRITSLDSIFYSDDDGSTWHLSKAPGIVIAGTTYYPSLAHVWNHDGTLFTSGTQGTSSGTLYFWRSSDNGANWTASSNGITSQYPGPTPKVLYGAGNTLYAGTENSGIILSNDNGLTWTTARTGIATYSFGGLTSFVNINGLAAVGRDVFAGLGGNISAVGYGVAHANLGDTSWTSASAGLPANSVVLALVSAGTSVYASVASYGTFTYGMFRSTDLGASWSKVSTGLPYPGYSQNLFAAGNSIFAYAGTGLYELNNADTSWTAVDNAGLPSVYTVSAYAVVGSTMFITVLNGSVPLHATTAIWKRDLAQITSVEEVSSAVPASFSLAQNYPNPFNPTTTIGFRVSEPSRVTLTIYDLLGETIATLVDKDLAPGSFEATWDARSRASGVYFCRLQARSSDGRAAGTFTQTNKLLLQK